MMSGKFTDCIILWNLIDSLDFEFAIRDSFISYFPDVEPKGCAFHFVKAIIQKVSGNGFRGQYSNPECPSGQCLEPVTCPFLD